MALKELIFQIRKGRLFKIYRKFKLYTMISPVQYVYNLSIAEKALQIEGEIVECGVWKGGMIAGIAEIFGSHRAYHLFDSFEGLPDASEIDGAIAMNWKNEKDSPWYFDNCKIDESFAQRAMSESPAVNVTYHKGWFENTVPLFPQKNIAVLRLDGDWYESTYICLQHLFPKVSQGGIIIIDDYYAFEGCAKAVHDYLSKESRSERINQLNNSVCYIVKS